MALELIVISGCIAIGFLANRWWLAVVAGLGVGVYFGINGEVELDHAFFGVLAGLLVSVPILVGVGLRQILGWLLERRRAK